MDKKEPKRTSPSKRRKSRGRAERSPEARAAKILRELRSLGKALAERVGMAPRELAPLGRLVLPVTIDLARGDDEATIRELSARLVRDYDGQIEEAMRALVAFRPGHVYCFQCGSCDCVHSEPGDPVEVFRGYSATGKPIWQSFLNLCLDRGEPRVDRLYDDDPEVLAIFQPGTDLKGELLPSFGRGSVAFNILGQVTVGLVSSNLGRRPSSPGRLAFGIQVVETGRDDVGRRLRLNLLGLSPDDIASAASRQPRGTADRLRQLLRATRRRVDNLGRKAAHAARRREALDLDVEAEPILERLRSDLERLFRPHPTRTQHAEKRHLGGDRPTSSALRDAREANLESVYFDQERQTIVVIGRRGRAHVFSLDGRHVTSIQLRPGEIERKTSRARWRRVRRAQLESFQQRLFESGG